MSFADAVKTCLSKFLHVAGRASRSEYWWFYLFVILATAAASVLDGIIFGFAVEDHVGKHPFTMLTSFVLFFPTLAAGWRRMHDINQPGWYVLLPQILIACGFLVFLVTVGVFGMIAPHFEATPTDERTMNNVILVTVEILAVAAVVIASLVKLWWLTRPGDPHPNQYGNPPA